jgi:hypothetical protein
MAVWYRHGARRDTIELRPKPRSIELACNSEGVLKATLIDTN